ncbi:Putative MetA-pathway of phenol degradation [Polaribacter sp. KT25b]|uniref:transporter n=1 Tax=Polaribacter sp. KT25b TaxID=1855336 RepID=UPI00087BCBB7|nr:transporter [Polaribacter sp. KT25b]SDS21500.1 Putative MetA-pathway of phenol degradation [Polaribacter sp. KT25b]
MKNRKLKLFSLLFLLGFCSIYGQYTEVINSNKPGFSESPYSVGKGVYQFESNLFLRNNNIEPTFSVPNSFGFDMLFRTSLFFEKLELNTHVSYQKDKIVPNDISIPDYSTSGFREFTIGAKYLIFQQEYKDKSKEIRSWKRKHAFDINRLTPSIAIYVGINTDFINDIYKMGSISSKIGLLFQQDLSTDFNLVSNFYYDKIGTEFFDYSFIITATYTFGNRWSTFFENQTEFQEHQNTTNFGTGLAFLYNKNLQINSSARYYLDGREQGFYAAFGVSYRIDKHKDSFKEKNNSRTKVGNTPISSYNKKEKGFFSRIFGIFAKKKTTRKRPKRKRNN